jgi:hypothetical protein
VYAAQSIRGQRSDVPDALPADHGNKFIILCAAIASWSGPNSYCIPFSFLILFVRVFFLLLQYYFVSFTLLSARGSSAMGRFPRSPALLILQLGQGFSFHSSV